MSGSQSRASGKCSRTPNRIVHFCVIRWWKILLFGHGPNEFLECYGENWFCFLRLFFDKTDHSNCSDNDPMHNDLKSRHSDFYVILFDMICQNNPQSSKSMGIIPARNSAWFCLPWFLAYVTRHSMWLHDFSKPPPKPLLVPLLHSVV